MVWMKCKFDNCGYEMEFINSTKRDAKDWMKQYIQDHHKSMKCCHELIEGRK